MDTVTKIGDPEALKKAYVAENRRNREKLLTDDLLWLFKPEPWKHAAYLRNRFEISAQKWRRLPKSDCARKSIGVCGIRFSPSQKCSN
ncbi:MAG: hypothetical protein HC869_16650 [Rhodospirillales bacterium]|nr:hypothetical protein [Rhodospirillales bacterium]